MTEAHVIRLLESSRLFQLAVRSSAGLSAAARESATAAMLRRGAAMWSRSATLRRRSSGIVLVVAGLVHLGWRATVPAAGWLWLVLPLWALVIGALLILASPRASLER